VRQRTLVIQCAQDAIAPVSVGRYVHRQIPGSEFALLDTSGHCPHMSAPAETIEAIRSFLRAEAP
ncbi:MAG TPA: alpha/beta hydrolase, partial [Phycisphaerales bacterium]|nr:alpha/beta hydrolase [Phycisphaerales bacterium]